MFVTGKFAFFGFELQNWMVVAALLVVLNVLFQILSKHDRNVG
jgi:hypothetical protein